MAIKAAFLIKGKRMEAGRVMHSFETDGVSIAYIDLQPETGPKGIILLIHGFASNHRINWVDTSWTKRLGDEGFRVIALDNRGHGQSGKLYEPGLYTPAHMAKDAIALLNHLGIEKADIMGYSMGARVTAVIASTYPDRVRSALLGGLGIHLVEGNGLPPGIAEALEAASLEDVREPVPRMFRAFADRTGSDRRALAACMRGSRQGVTREELQAFRLPVHIAVGTKDEIAGDPHALAALIPGAEAFDIVGRDHNLAVGDRTHKDAVVEFLRRRP
jgi:pimeloyl-ACP methyl ester carboxylesterase